MKLLPSLFSCMYSRVKLFVFAMNSRRRYSIFVCFIYGLQEKNSKSEVIFAVCHLPLTSYLTSLLNTFSSHSVLLTAGDHRIRSYTLQRMVLYLAPIHIASWHLGLEKTSHQQPNRRNLLSFQSLPLVHRIFQLSVSCPACSKSNDFDFRHCQRCGYQR